VTNDGYQTRIFHTEFDERIGDVSANSTTATPASSGMRSAVILKKTFAILFGIIRIHRFNMDMESRVFSNFYERESLRGTFRRDISSRLFSLARDAFLFPLQLRSTIQLSMYGIFGRIAETSRQLRDSNARRCLDAIPIIRVQ